MREGVEGGFASVSTLTRVSHSAEGKGGDGAVVKGVVDGSTARGNLVEDCDLLEEVRRETRVSIGREVGAHSC